MKPDLMYSRQATDGNHWWVPCPDWVPEGEAFRDPDGARWLPAPPEAFIKWPTS
jgi:hypothetical protein